MTSAQVGYVIDGEPLHLWAQDEARLGLIPVVRRVWAACGERPLALGQRRYQWLYLYGFVRPGGGEVQWIILPDVDTEIFSLALKHFAGAVGAGPQQAHRARAGPSRLARLEAPCRSRGHPPRVPPSALA